MVISTHAPLAGRDRLWMALSITLTVFQPTRPLRGATWGEAYDVPYTKISTHAPLAGRDLASVSPSTRPRNFNPRAPCGARLGGWEKRDK